MDFREMKLHCKIACINLYVSPSMHKGAELVSHVLLPLANHVCWLCSSLTVIFLEPRFISYELLTFYCYFWAFLIYRFFSKCLPFKRQHTKKAGRFAVKRRKAKLCVIMSLSHDLWLCERKSVLSYHKWGTDPG